MKSEHYFHSSRFFPRSPPLPHDVDRFDAENLTPYPVSLRTPNYGREVVTNVMPLRFLTTRRHRGCRVLMAARKMCVFRLPRRRSRIISKQMTVYFPTINFSYNVMSSFKSDRVAGTFEEILIWRIKIKSYDFLSASSRVIGEESF